MADIEDPDGYLFLVVDKKFYRLSKPDMLKVATEVTHEKEPLATETLETLMGTGFVLADIQGPGESPTGRPDSCACVAINIDHFDARIREKQGKIIAARNASSTTKEAATKVKAAKV